jgi:hypothetical protein
VLVAAPESEQAALFRQLAGRVAARTSIAALRPLPAIR